MANPHRCTAITLGIGNAPPDHVFVLLPPLPLSLLLRVSGAIVWKMWSCSWSASWSLTTRTSKRLASQASLRHLPLLSCAYCCAISFTVALATLQALCAVIFGASSVQLSKTRIFVIVCWLVDAGCKFDREHCSPQYLLFLHSFVIACIVPAGHAFPGNVLHYTP